MSFKCKNICDNIKIAVHFPKNVYGDHLYCRTCEAYFIKGNGFRCKCCKCPLRSSGRHTNRNKI